MQSPAPARLRPGRSGGFTLIEMMVVIGIILAIFGLFIPAMNPLKTANDVTNSSYVLSSVLEQARSYAMSNNTYVWVGFYEEDASVASTTPATPGNGRVILSTVASADGTTVYNSNSPAIDPTQLKQVNKLVKIDNLHLQILPDGTGAGDTFDTRPIPDTNPFTGSKSAKFGDINSVPVANSAPATNTQFPFQYPVGAGPPTAQYVFAKTLQFNPRGEANINSTYALKRICEIGLRPTHGASVDTATPNVVALQFTGIGGNFKIFRR